MQRVGYMKHTKWDINKVRQFVKENSDCELITNEYKTVDTKMEFKCRCGQCFTTTFDKFRARNKRQCNSCGYKESAERQKPSYEKVKEFIEVQSQSGCKLISTEYKNAHQKLKVQCKCGEIYEVPWRHFKNSNQRQCPECGIKIVANARRLPIEEVTTTIEQKDCKLLSEYQNIDSKIKIQCACGKIFHTSYGLFRDYDINKCPDCRSENGAISKGENKIRCWLNSNNISFVEQYTFPKLKGTNKLRYDFAILNDKEEVKLIIEFDGKQHFGIGNFTDDTDEMLVAYQRVLESDYKKNQYCFMNSIPLLRIHYNNYPRINKILEKTLLQ